jgi:hypothetical protein
VWRKRGNGSSGVTSSKLAESGLFCETVERRGRKKCCVEGCVVLTEKEAKK